MEGPDQCRILFQSGLHEQFKIGSWMRQLNDRQGEALMEIDLRNYENTFSEPEKSGKHIHGSHWEMFFDASEKAIMALVDKVVNNRGPLPCWADSYPPPFCLHDHQPVAFPYTWPMPRQGVIIVISPNPSSKIGQVETLFPWASEGVEHEITLNKVYPWSNRLEAQITGTIADGIEISYFDTEYVRHRAYYAAGMSYQFVLSGFAYACRVIKAEPIHITDPAFIKIWKTGVKKIAGKDTITFHTTGMTAFYPVDNADRDDYHFQTKVKHIVEYELMNVKAYRIRGAIFRTTSPEKDYDLDIYVTERALKGRVPKVGDDISGNLWLQGYMSFNPCTPAAVLRNVLGDI